MKTGLLIVLALALPAQILAESQSDTQKIRVFDSQEVWDNWMEYQQMVRELEAMQRLDQGDIERLQRNVLARSERLEKDMELGVVSQRDFEIVGQALAREARDVSGYARVRERIIQNRIDQAQDNRKKMIRQALLEHTDRESIGIVIKSTDVAYRVPELEISRDIVMELNRSDRVRIERELREIQNNLRSGQFGQLPRRSEALDGLAPFDPALDGD